MDKQKIEEYRTRNPFTKLSDLIAQAIYDEIISLNLKPSSKLNVNQIANDFGVSRTPVAEAMTKLMEMGFVVTHPGINGYYVVEINVLDLLDLFSARAALECEAAALCAENADPQAIKRLEELATAFQQAIPSGDGKALQETDLPFHQLLIESCQNRYIIKSYNALLPNIRMYQSSWTKFIDPGKENPWARKVLNQHAAIVTAIKMHIPSLARQLMREHIRESANFVAYSETTDDPFLLLKRNK